MGMWIFRDNGAIMTVRRGYESFNWLAWEPTAVILCVALVFVESRVSPVLDSEAVYLCSATKVRGYRNKLPVEDLCPIAHLVPTWVSAESNNVTGCVRKHVKLDRSDCGKIRHSSMYQLIHPSVRTLESKTCLCVFFLFTEKPFCTRSFPATQQIDILPRLHHASPNDLAPCDSSLSSNCSGGDSGRDCRRWCAETSGVRAKKQANASLRIKQRIISAILPSENPSLNSVHADVDRRWIQRKDVGFVQVLFKCSCSCVCRSA